MGRNDLPTGTVTFLFTDAVGSTNLLHALGDAAYAEALAEHRRVLRATFQRHGGVEVDTQGDAFFVAFATAPGALAAAADVRDALEQGPIAARMGIHTGTPLLTEEGYVGVDVHRAGRIAAAGHGGQVLVSAATAALAADEGVSFLDLGEHRLKDLAAPERIYQLGDRAFPPLKSLSASNLPVPATAFLGREHEVESLSGLLRDPARRLLTVTGPGGIGKTRLALQAAAESTAAFPDGLWWVTLASLRDPTLVSTALAQALGVREQEGVDLSQAIRARVSGRRLLVLLDNAEHLLPAVAEVVTRLLESSEELTVLVTSRERMQLAAEHVFAVPPMSSADAVEFFRERAASLGLALDRSDAVPALCERLDRLPLALQLAAARLRIFSPEQLLGRLSGRLDLLKGVRDIEPRQRTLRATIEWSHDLLTPDEQVLFQRLAVFVGGCTLAAAEGVCDADVDVLEGLVDKSLLQCDDGAPEPRFWMLEAIRDFAAEQAAGSARAQDVRARHARYLQTLAERMDAQLRAGEPEELAVSVLEADIDNYAEAWSWFERALALADEEDDTRRRLLLALGKIAYTQGDHGVAVAASDEAASLAMRLGGVDARFELMKEQAREAVRSGEIETAEKLFQEAQDLAIAVGNGVGTSSCRLNLAYLANKTRRHDRAETLLAENLPFVRARGQTRCEAYTLASIAETSIYVDRPQRAVEHAVNAIGRASSIGDKPLEAFCLDLVAASAAARGDLPRAATLLGATEAAREEMGVVPDEQEEAIRAWALAHLPENSHDIEAAWAEGRALDIGAALELTAT